MLRLKIAPADDLLTLTEAKNHLRVDGSTEDTLISSLIDAATATLDGPRGKLGRALVEQEWTLILDSFSAEITIPLPRLMSIDEIRYLNTSGDEITLAASEYEAIGIGGDEPAYVRPAYGKEWPDTWDFPGAVEIDFSAGYGAAAAVPDPIKQAALLLIGHLYANREATSWAQALQVLPMGFDDLIQPYRIWGFGS